MDAVFLKILNMSIAAGWLILAVVVLRFLLKKAPKWLPCVLWAVVAIRLVCPFSFESVFSLIPSAETVPHTVITGNSFDISTSVNAIDIPVNEYLGDNYYEGVTVPSDTGSRIMEILAWFGLPAWLSCSCTLLSAI